MENETQNCGVYNKDIFILRTEQWIFRWAYNSVLRNKLQGKRRKFRQVPESEDPTCPLALIQTEFPRSLFLNFCPFCPQESLWEVSRHVNMLLSQTSLSCGLSSECMFIFCFLWPPIRLITLVSCGWLCYLWIKIWLASWRPFTLEAKINI